MVKKLGIKPESALALDGAPERFEQLLTGLPEGARVARSTTASRDLTLWFVRTREELDDRIRHMGAHADRGGLWILWPKKRSGVKSDLSQNVVRAVGLAAGLVDFKICSVDKTWSGLRFTVRRR